MALSECGGIVTTSAVGLGSLPKQLVGADNNRTRVTIRASQSNDAAVYIMSQPVGNYREGFPLYPGEAYQFDSVGARAAVYGVGPFGGDKGVYIMTESGFGGGA